MQGGPTPAGETSPPNLLDITCIPDIQQSTSIGVNSDKQAVSANPTSNNNIGNNLPERQSSTGVLEDPSLRSKGNRASSLLLVTHIVEITAMVLATLLRFFPQEYNNIISHQSVHPKLSLPYEESSKEEFSPLVLGVHISILILPLIIVTAISLHWVLRVQDFSGRVVARLVCWLLHFLQSSLVWRYLKLQIAYDPGDLAELGMLRFIQLHLHILPFLVMHVAITLTYPRSLGFALSLTFALLLSVVITIVVSTVVRQQLAPPAVTQAPQFTVTDTQPQSSSKSEDSKYHIVVGATKLCVLWSRVVSIAALFCLHAIWAAGLIIMHWVIAVIWLGFQKEVAPSVLNSSRQIVRKSILGFLLLWDWQILGNEESSHTICLRPQLPVVYYTIVASQNIAATCAWYVTKRFQGISLLYTIILTSVIISQFVALLLLSLSYMYYSSYFLKWSNKKTASSSASQKPAVLVTPKGKASLSGSDITSVESPPAYINYGNIGEGSDHTRQTTEQHKCGIDDKISNQADLIKHTNDRKETKYSASLTPRLLSNHLHLSMFSYANDILQHTSKSERSSTDNGSFNSRNTNTLNTPGAVIPDYEISHRPHGSFSDSFSSLSCGTVSKVASSTPKGNLGSQLHPHNLKRLKHRKSCQKSYQGKILTRVSHDCAGVEEEQDEVVVSEDAPDDQNSSVSAEKGTSPPRVAVVRATQRFQVVCTKCLNAHDPLLTRCKLSSLLNGPPSLSYSCAGELGVGGSSSTDYPSDTELTTTIDTLSSVSAESHSTYTTWPVGKGPGLAKLLMREKGGHDYVTAWLRHQQARAVSVLPSSDANTHHDTQKRTNRMKIRNQNRETSSKCLRNPRRNGQRTRLRIQPSFFQDLETVV